MEIGGVALLAVVVLVFALVPQIVQRRSAIMESREGDRFSPSLYVVAPARGSMCAAQRTHRLISQETHIRHREGVAMSAHLASARRPSQVSGAKARAHEIAQLRAQRVARRSAEVASGQRRMVAAGVFTGLFVVSLVVVFFSSSLSWLWPVAPLAGLLSVLLLSRRAAVVAQRADEADRQRLAELKADVRPVSRGAGDSAGVSSPVVAVPVADGVCVREADVVSTVVERGDAGDSGASASVVGVERSSDGVEEGQDRKAWTPTPLPASRYSRGARVEGRVVHADTDLRGIPRVKAAVPARPIAPTVDVHARSTDEVAASVPLAFDLEEILEARRA